MPPEPLRPGDLPAPPSGRTGWPWTEAPGPAPASDGRALPKITVVTPSFNQARFVEATLRSVLLQGYPNLEYLVLDGGSTDGSRAIVERYAPWLAGWTSERDRGQSDAINRGFARATGEIVAWLNSDDRYPPGTLHAVARAAIARRDAAAWVGRCRSVDVFGRVLQEVAPRGLDFPALAAWYPPERFAQPACFFSREAVKSAGPLDEGLHSSFDVDFFVRVRQQGPFVAVDELWAEETIHEDAKTSAKPGRSLAELHAVQMRHGFEAIAVAQMTAELEELWARRRSTLFQRSIRLARGSLALARRLSGRR